MGGNWAGDERENGMDFEDGYDPKNRPGSGGGKKPKPELVPCTGCEQTGEKMMAESPGQAYDMGSSRMRQQAFLSQVPTTCNECHGWGWKMQAP